MGQYYAPVLMAPDSTELKVAATAYSWDFDCGLKLMEHSWVGNPFVRRIESALMGNPMRVVWAGDYADVEPGSGSNLYDDASASLPGTASLRALDGPVPDTCYLVNHTKGLFVDMMRLPVDSRTPVMTWTIHPLPLLTAEGNGRGGGDYHGADMEHVGSWARDVISCEDGHFSPEDHDLAEFKPAFKE